MKKHIITLLFALVSVAGFSQTGNYSPFNQFGFQWKVVAGDTSVRSVGSTVGKYVYLPTFGGVKKIIDSVSLLKVNKPQKTFYADDFSDTFSGFSSDGFNHNSAIWKILNQNNFKDVRIVLSEKRYKPIGNAAAYYTLNNVSIIGAKQPYFKNGLETLEKGTIIEGPISVLQPSSNVYCTDFGVDAGKTVTDTYFGGNATVAFMLSYAVAPGTQLWGKNAVVTNITTLVRDPNAIEHSFLLERFKGGYVNNIKSAFAIYGIVIKSQGLQIGSLSAYGNKVNNVLFKSGETYTYTGNITVESIEADKFPPGIDSSWVAIPASENGLYFEGGIPISDIRVDKVAVNNCDKAIVYATLTNGVVGSIAINQALISSCNYGLVRSGGGFISNIYVGALKTYNISTNLIDFSGGTAGSDTFVSVGNISHSAGGLTMQSAFKLSEGKSLNIDNAEISNATNVYDISSNSSLIVNNLTQVSNVANLYKSGSATIKRRNLTLDNTNTAYGNAFFSNPNPDNNFLTQPNLYWNYDSGSGKGLINAFNFQTGSALDIALNNTGGNVSIGKLNATQKLDVDGNVLANSYIKSGGTASQFLMADGSTSTTGTNLQVSSGVLSTVASPDFTTLAATDNSTKAATTAQVQAAINLAGNNSFIKQGGNSFGAPVSIGSNDNQLVNFKVNNVDVMSLTSGAIRAIQPLQNSTTGNNSTITLGVNGTTVSRSVSDANPTLTVNQANASSTGNIQNWQFAGSNLATLANNGLFTSSKSYFNTTAVGDVPFQTGTGLTGYGWRISNVGVATNAQALQSYFGGNTLVNLNPNGLSFFNTTGNFVYGGSSDLGAKINIISTGAQLDLAYDATNKARFQVGSTGNITVSPSGGTFSITGKATVSVAPTNPTDVIRKSDLDAVTVTPVSVAGTSQTMSPNVLYVPSSASLTTFTLPAIATFGQRFQVVGDGSGGWRVAQNAGQQIVGVNVATTSGTTGYIQSGNKDCTLTLIAISSTRFKITSSQGTLTIN